MVVENVENVDGDDESRTEQMCIVGNAPFVKDADDKNTSELICGRDIRYVYNGF